MLNSKLSILPDNPGVYLMKNSKNQIIYVGKAKILKNRVRQYFQNNKNHSPKVRAMVKNIADFEIIITSSEIEALILECNLIKKFQPRYNILLKDDKNYPFLKLTVNEDFPRIFITRKKLDDGAKYFGPFTNSSALKETLNLLQKIFPLRTCKNFHKRPCLEYHIKNCLAPCANLISKEIYAELVKSTINFLEGKTSEIIKNLTEKMNLAAENLNFELAAKFRDILLSVKKISEKQKIVTDSGNLDVIGISRLNEEICVQIFFVREGKVIGRENFMIKGAAEEENSQILVEFIKQYYNFAEISSDEILLPVEIFDEDVKILEEWLKVEINCPKRGIKRELVEMAVENAEKYLKEKILINEKKLLGVEELQKSLKLAIMPRKMECFDISHFQGSETVASMVRFENGAPAKKMYRRYKIHSTEGKPDDFLSMREVVSRRYKNLENLPDLIIIDGGKGQLNSALEVIRELKIEIPVISLAKEFELVFEENSSEPIKLEGQALFLMQRIRDEAHRFAITYHRKLRRKRNLESELDKIAGIGVKRREELLKTFGSVENIKNATLEEILKLPSMNRNSAESLINYFKLEKSK